MLIFREFLSRLSKFNDLLARVETWILTLLVLAMVCFAFLQVVLRNLFASGLLAGDVILRHLVLWVGFIGASLATREGRHITIDVFARLLHGRIKTAIQLVINLFSIYVTYLLTLAAIDFVAMERSFQSMLFGNVEAWYFQIIIPIGFALICLRLLFLLPQQIYNLLAGEAE